MEFIVLWSDLVEGTILLELASLCDFEYLILVQLGDNQN